MAAAAASFARCEPSSLTDLLDDNESGMPRLPPSLRARLNITKDRLNCAGSSKQNNTFVLYLPTVVLRLQHNPAFALAARLANHWQVPLLVLGVVLDDAAHAHAHHHHNNVHNIHSQQQHESNNNSVTPPPELAVVHTARRLAFALQAYQKAAREWSELGAAVWLRVHGAPGARTPHHLTLARRAAVTVTDEPFVHPYRALVEAVERTCRNSGGCSSGAVVRVDGSTTVPPVSILRQQQRDSNSNPDGGMASTTFRGVPDKAWKWQKQTSGKRKWHVLAAVRDGALDAPALQVRASSSSGNALLSRGDDNSNNNNNPMARFLPRDWLDPSTPAPGRRPWTVDELQNLNIEDWVLHHCPGVDTSVPICPQTHGAAGAERWKQFQQNSLAEYARRRNDVRQPHAVSRLSCYLNLGTVSILQIVHDLWYSSNNHRKNTSKFEDEIIKWREISYAHCFATPQYFAPAAVPAWARNCWNRQWQQQLPQQQPSNKNSNINASYTWQQLADGTTADATWNAMQRYLVETGELHNNARMTWGKTIAVEWGALHRHQHSLGQVLAQLATLNDRFALDGLSPPSYAGLLWCLGWGDRPAARDGGSIPRKPASRYRVGPEGFALAQQRLLSGCGGVGGGGTEEEEESVDATAASVRRATTHTNTTMHGGQLTITKAFQRQREQQQQQQQRSQHQSPTKKAKVAEEEKKNHKDIGSTSTVQPAVLPSSAPSSGKKPKRKHSITDYFAATSAASSTKVDRARVVG